MAAPVQFVDGIRYLKFNKTDLAGRNNAVTLKSIQKIRMGVGNGASFIDLIVTGVTELANSVLVQVAPFNINPVNLGFQENFNFDPYLPEEFFNSDYNALQNNAFQAERSEILFESDYKISQITASNINAILSGSAQLAEFNDYYLSLNSFKNPRYDGSKLQGAELNKFTQGDSSYGGDPVINYTDSTFAYFNFIGGTSPERNDTVAAHIGFIVDRNGEALQPAVSEVGHYDMLNTYKTGNKIEVVLDDPEAFDVNMSILNGMQEVVRSGVRIEPIVYSQTGSQLGNRAGTLTFGSDVTIAENFKALAVFSGSSLQVQPSATAVIPYNDEVYDIPSAFNPVSYQYKVPFTSSTLINIVASAIVEKNANSQNRIIYKIVLQRSGSDTGGVFVEIVNKIQELPLATPSSPNKPLTVSVGTGPITALSGSFYRAILTVGNLTSSGVRILSGSFFKVDQVIEPNIAVTAPYWISGSAVYSQSYYNMEDKYLVAQGTLKNALGINQIDIVGSGFNNIKYPFSIQEGDEIRFEGQESKSHLIVKVYNPQDPFIDYTVGILPPLGAYGKEPNTGFLILEVKPSVFSNTNIDNFVVRRYVEDKNFIIFKSQKPGGQTSAGLIKPEYLSQDILDNFDQINRRFRLQTLRNT